MMFYGSTEASPGSSVKNVSARQLTGSKRTSMYPNPFMDIAATYLPATTKDLFRWCEYYALTNPLVATVLYKKATYPVTDVIYEEENDPLRERYRHLFEDVFRIRPFLIEHNLDKAAYGNAFVSVVFPIRKWLECSDSTCKHRVRVDRITYKFQNYEFRITCPKCSHDGAAKVIDVPIPSPEEIRLMRWSPHNIRIQYSEITGERIYFLDLPKQVKNDIAMGRPHVVEKIPQEFIKGAKEGKAIRFLQGQIYHSFRPTVSGRDPAWGQPLLAQVLKQVFYLQVLQKAQEAILFGHIIPMRILYPAATSQTGEPYSMINLANWKENVNDEIRAFRADSLYMPVMPIPVGYQNVGGEGKALMLANEIRVWSELVVSGLGFPVEFIFSGISYSGSNVSLRILENEFLGDREDCLGLLRWIMSKVSAYMEWRKIPLKLRPFKMADDLQRAAFNLQLVQMKALSMRSFMEDLDRDFDQEKERVRAELPSDQTLQRDIAKYQAETQGQNIVVQAKYQAQQQGIMGDAALEQQQKQQAAQMQAQQDAAAAQQEQQQPAPGPMAAQPAQQSSRPSIGGPGSIVGLSSPMSQQGVENAQKGTVDLAGAAQRYAAKLKGMPEVQQGQALYQLKTSNQELYQLVLQYMYAPEPGTPLPEQRAPRRASGKAQV